MFGLDALGAVADRLYADADPEASCYRGEFYRLTRTGGTLQLSLALPGAEEESIACARTAATSCSTTAASSAASSRRTPPPVGRSRAPGYDADRLVLALE